MKVFVMSCVCALFNLSEIGLEFILSPFCQLAAQVLDDLDDEDIGFGVLDEKKDSAVAKKLGTLQLSHSLLSFPTVFFMTCPSCRCTKRFSVTFIRRPKAFKH